MFIITAGEGKRLILYARTSRTYELICAVDNEDSLFSALERFCRKFRTKLQMERYIQDYQSSVTKQGTIYKEYNRLLKQEWEGYFTHLYQRKIDGIINEVFAQKLGSQSFIRKKFKVVKV